MPSTPPLHPLQQTPPPTLNTPRHIQYFLRCLKTHLPTHYQSSESQRVSFAFFTLSALDLLGALHAKTTAAEREEWATWLYGLQHSGGGWKGFTGADVGGGGGRGKNVWDPANLGATFLALGALMVLGDSMERVKRRECLGWLQGLQRGEGCFGEMRGKEGAVEGGGDVRFCYLAAGVRWMLRRGEEGEGERDIDVEALVGFVRRSVTYEGGIAEVPGHEAHAGETFCGIAALKLLGRLPSSAPYAQERDVQSEVANDDFVETVTRWLVYRQTLQLCDENEEDEDEETYAESENSNGTASHSSFKVEGSHVEKASVVQSVPPQPASIEVPPEQLLWAGFNGRCNKAADTCYAWWVGGSLGMLQRQHLQNFNAVGLYLLDKTQHRIGGFSKMPGDPPDILHSYLGLAALAVMKHSELKSIDSRLCMSVSAREYFERGTALGRGEALESEKSAGKT